MKAKANLFRTLVVLPVVLLVAVAVAFFGVGLRTAEPQEPQSAATQTTTPKMQDLGSLGGRSVATGINGSGKVVGHSSTSVGGSSHAFLYDASATPKMQDLGDLGGGYSRAWGINDSGKVVGESYTSDGEQHAFLYDASATPKMQDLNDLIPADSGRTINEATAINSDGKIAANGSPYGWPSPCNPYVQSTSFTHGFVLTPATTPTPATYEMQDLGTLGGDYSYATGINTSGKAVGYSMTSDCYSAHAFRYDASATPKMQDLGTLGSYNSEATGINASGLVVGRSESPLYQDCVNFNCWRAFLYDASATPKMQDLGDFGTGFSRAYGINDFGKVVGGSGSRAFLYDVSATPRMQDLGTLGGSSSVAMGINASGQVVGASDTSDGGFHAFLYDASASATLDKTTPTVSSVSPASGATNVARNTSVTGTFSEKMDPNSITTSTFKLYQCPSTTSTNCTTQVTNVTVSPSNDGLSATLDPYGTSSTLLASSTRYKAVVTTGAKDVAGNALNQQKNWYFTTGSK